MHDEGRLNSKWIANWASWVLLIAIAVFSAVNAFVPYSQTVYFDTGPAAAERLIWMATWDADVEHSEVENGTQCDDEAAASESQCTQILDLEHLLPWDASSALLRIKAKAWNRTSVSPSYCLIYARAAGTNATFSNHFIHTEEWSGGQDDLEERRRINYTTISLPAAEGVGITVGKQITGECSVEFVVYLEGYIVRRSLLERALQRVFG